MMRTKLIFFSTYAYALFAPETNIGHGGAEVQIYYLAKNLSKKEDFDVGIIVGDFNQNCEEKQDGLRLIKSFNPQSHESFVTKLLQATKYIHILLKEKPDVVFTTSANSNVGLVGLYAKHFGIKHIHRTANETDVNGVWVQKNGLLGRIYKWGLENASVVLTQNLTHKKQLKQLHRLDAIVFKNAFEIKPHKKTKREHVLWVARFLDWKRPNVFLELAKRIPKEKFVMVCPNIGDMPEKEWVNFKRQSSEINNLDLIESVPFNQIQALFDKATIFVNTSSKEGFPNTFIQAGISSCPIVSYSVNPDNFILNKGCGYVADTNFEQLVTHCQTLLTKKNDWAEKSSNIYHYTYTEHNIAQRIDELENIIVNMFE